MNVAVYTANETFFEMFLTELFYMGLSVYKIDEISNMEIRMVDKKIDCLILDIDSKPPAEWLKLIRTLKANANTCGLNILIFTAVKNQEFLYPFISEGINGIFDTTQAFSNYVKKLFSIMKIIEQELDHKRQYARVKIPPEEVIAVNLQHSNKTYPGRLVDISVVAAAIKLNDSADADTFKEKGEIENIQIKLDKKIIFCAGNILKKAKDLVIVQFDNPNDIFKKTLVHFIFGKISV